MQIYTNTPIFNFSHVQDDMKMTLFLMAFIDLLCSRSVEIASSGSQFEGQPFDSFLASGDLSSKTVTLKKLHTPKGDYWIKQ